MISKLKFFRNIDAIYMVVLLVSDASGLTANLVASIAHFALYEGIFVNICLGTYLYHHNLNALLNNQRKKVNIVNELKIKIFNLLSEAISSDIIMGDDGSRSDTIHKY